VETTKIPENKIEEKLTIINKETKTMETDKKQSSYSAVLHTTAGDITIKLNDDQTPKTVQNFVDLAKKDFYNGVIFHRVIDGFMIQGGGFTKDFAQKPVHAAIENEAANGLKNLRGTLAMARTGEVNSATAQFFINVKDNDFLDFKSKTPSGYGYAVFGKVIEGMDIVDQIKTVKTGSHGFYQDVPKDPIVIISATEVK
jgi:cyclophilin family peptidyl-prolyl cis-trans isomerase